MRTSANRSRPVSICIATRVGAFEEIVQDGETGRLIPPEDPAELEGAIRSALQTPSTLKEWASACRPRAEAHFKIEHEAAALTAIYRDLLKGS